MCAIIVIIGAVPFLPRDACARRIATRCRVAAGTLLHYGTLSRGVHTGGKGQRTIWFPWVRAVYIAVRLKDTC